MTFSQSEKIQKISMVDQVFNRLKEMILGDELKPGDKLPSEAELAASFGVNRLTARMAIQKLNTAGVLETKVGDGTYVKTFSLAASLESITEFLFLEESAEDITDLRNLIEVECCRMAILRASDEEIAELAKCHDAFHIARTTFIKSRNTDYNSPQFEALLSADIAFHKKIYRMSHNTVYYDMFVLMRAVIESNLRHHLTTRIYEDDDKPFDNHTRVFKAIEARDFEECKEAYFALQKQEERL